MTATGTSSRAAQPKTGTPWIPAATFVFALVPAWMHVTLSTAALWVSLPGFQRWDYSNFLLAAAVVPMTVWSLTRHTGSRTSLSLLLAATALVIAGHVLYVVQAVAGITGNGNDSYVDIYLYVVGGFAMIVAAAIGLVGLVVRRAPWAAEH